MLFKEADELTKMSLDKFKIMTKQLKWKNLSSGTGYEDLGDSILPHIWQDSKNIHYDVFIYDNFVMFRKTPLRK